MLLGGRNALMTIGLWVADSLPLPPCQRQRIGFWMCYETHGANNKLVEDNLRETLFLWRERLSLLCVLGGIVAFSLQMTRTGISEE